MKVLVIGGAGYIGSHMVKLLASEGHEVTTLDNLSQGYRDAVRYGRLIVGDLADRDGLRNLFENNVFDGVMHFASYIRVGESVIRPAEYYRNNLVHTQNLLDAMLAHGPLRFIFSSTAAVYGEPEYVPVDEDHRKMPVNPYGRSKYMVEEILSDYESAYGLSSVCLRYFNAAGADPEGELGERHQPETHLIPLVLQAASGRRDTVTVFGRDYATPDGTCIRDYVHVEDLCWAHLFALEWLCEGGKSLRLNLGNGAGFSVQEVIDTAMRITGKEIRVVDEERRQGDPARLVADASLAHDRLGWLPRYGDLESMVAHAWAWERKVTGC